MSSSTGFERFTERAREVVVMAQGRARALGHDHIGTEHILLALLGEQQGLAARALKSVGVTAKGSEAQVVRIVGKGEAPSAGWLPFTAHAKSVLDRASDESLSLGQDVVATEHILLALLRENEGVGVRVLRDCDVDLYELRDELIVRAGGSYVPHGDEDTSSAAGPTIDPGWLDGLPTLLKPLGEEIRALGRAPDLGDLLLALVCVPDTPAAEALAGLGLDADALSGPIERARARAVANREAWAKRLTEVVAAKELAIEEGRSGDAATLRDHERELHSQARSTRWAQLATTAELRRRFGIPPTSQER